MIKVVKINGADIYRDGGSYGFCFDSDDGHWYEFFLEIKPGWDTGLREWYPPKLYFEGCNSKKIVKEFSWGEAKSFVAELSFDHTRFHELLDLVNSEGKIS